MECPPLQFQIISIDILDSERGTTHVHLFGRSRDAKLIHLVVTGFKSFFFIRFLNGFLSEALLQRKCKSLAWSYKCDIDYKCFPVKQLYGWIPADALGNGVKEFPAAQVFFSSLKGRSRGAAHFAQEGNMACPISVDEDWISPFNQFWDLTRLRPSGWVTVRDYVDEIEDSSISDAIGHSSTHSCHLSDLEPNDCDEIAPLEILSYDIECIGPRRGVFPMASRVTDKIISIGNSIRCVGSTETRHVYFGLHNLDSSATPSLQQADVRLFDSELHLLYAWRDWVRGELDPDIITGYNIMEFDWPYILERLEVLLRDPEEMAIVRGLDGSSQPEIVDAGDYANFGRLLFLQPLRFKQRLRQPRVIGRMDMDLLRWVKKYKKLPIYKLNAVSKAILKDQKEDLPPEEIYDCFFGSDADRARIATYCLKDCDLPLQLIEKLVVIPQIVEMSKVCITPLSQILGGQQKRIMSLICVKAHTMGYVVNRHKMTKSGIYEGATVLEPIGDYYVEPVATLDFSGLYPSIMQAAKLCFSTLVLDPGYVNLPAARYRYVEVQKDEPAVFVQQIEGVLPTILKDVLSARSAAKKEMAAASNDFMKNVYNGKQLALKLVANSLYGFTGVCEEKAIYPCELIARAVTCLGRSMIRLSKAYAEKFFPRERIFDPNAPWAEHLPTPAAGGLQIPPQGNAGLEQLDSPIPPDAEDILVIYGDTDSIMVLFRLGAALTAKQKLNLAFAVAIYMGAEITQLFHPLQLLEMEKIYFPYLLIVKKKKQYSGRIFYSPTSAPGIDIKGLAPVRRDKFPVMRGLLAKLLGILTWQTVSIDQHPSPSKEDCLSDCVKVIENVLSDYVDDLLPFDEYVMIKGLRDGYKKPLTQVQYVVNMKRKERNPGSEYLVGERVRYVIIKKVAKLLADKVEDADYAERVGLELDRLYYFDHYMAPSITKIFQSYGYQRIYDLFFRCSMTLRNQSQGQPTLFEFLGEPQAGTSQDTSSPTQELKTLPATSAPLGVLKRVSAKRQRTDALIQPTLFGGVAPPRSKRTRAVKKAPQPQMTLAMFASQ